MSRIRSVWSPSNDPPHRLSQQPEPVSSSGTTVSPARTSPQTGARSSSPDANRVPATGDHAGVTSSATGGFLASVGADFFTAAELAALKLPGLPQRREHISRLASRDGWTYRTRPGKGGGREFALEALPEKARGAIVRRRLEEGASKHGRTVALTAIENLTTKQSTRLGARTLVLAAFDRFRGERSVRSQLDPFVAAMRDGLVELPGWSRDQVTRISTRTLRRWHDARAKQSTRELAGASRRGPLAVLERSPEAGQWIVGAKLHQPQLSFSQLAMLIGVEFPGGVPDASGLLMPLPNARAISRFHERWISNPLNRQLVASLTDPDHWKSHYRFSGGNASEGIMRLNQRWEIDGSPADLLCTDGRYSLVVVIDVFSRRLMGLVTDTPKTAASLLLVKRACETWGVPEILVTDNGSDFVSHQFVDVMQRLGITHAPMPPHSPERKGFIERHIRTVQHRFMSMLDGFIGHNVAERSRIENRRSFAQRLGETDENLFSVKLDSFELQQKLDAFLVNIYARTPHRGLGGATPELRALQGAELNPPKFADASAIGMLLMPPPGDGPTRIVTKKGVSVNGLDYYCERMLVGQRLQVRLDPADLGAIYLYTDTNPRVFIGIGINPDVKGIDRRELAGRVRAHQDEIMRKARAEGRAMARGSNLSATVSKLIGTAPQLERPTNGSTHETPDLVEAAIAATADAMRPRRKAEPAATPEEQAEHQSFVVEFQTKRVERRLEETPDERFERWKKLAAVIEAGGEISAESLEWFRSYENLPECVSLRMVEEELGG